ncbi:hypothetical protein SAMN05443252_11415 [Bacillus sp. OV322]|uniref:cyclic-phosphate processing receiver domain-containing protein n=1 Tax=Bacillus sp. OV322 TaxID=1882764 RepID=UPI0008E09D5F|nr:cyclic-phosphate processing receiver domain-containing protein [Bacillus sp. OV322]SFD02263.1 hypothetical protein SAMN05443252_11415 [Bacillus sp. OV322]
MTKNIINLYVDDLRDCPEGFIIARTVDEAINLCKQYKIHLLSLDHDLGEDECGLLLPTGYDFVKYFCQHAIEEHFEVDKIYLHTDNPVGRENMLQTLLASRKRGFISKETEIYRYSITKNKYSG